MLDLKFTRLIIKINFSLLLFFLVFHHFGYSQYAFNSTNKNTSLKNGIYIFYNYKNCSPCYTTLRDYFLKIKKNSHINFIAVFLIDSNYLSINNFEILRKKQFPYADSVIVEYSKKPMDKYFSDQVPSEDGLFHKFKIYYNKR